MEEKSHVNDVLQLTELPHNNEVSSSGESRVEISHTPSNNSLSILQLESKFSFISVVFDATEDYSKVTDGRSHWNNTFSTK